MTQKQNNNGGNIYSSFYFLCENAFLSFCVCSTQATFFLNFQNGLVNSVYFSQNPSLSLRVKRSLISLLCAVSVHMNFRSEMNFGWAHGIYVRGERLSLSNLIYFNKIFNQIERVSVRAMACRAAVLLQLMNWILWILRSRRRHRDSWLNTDWSF